MPRRTGWTGWTGWTRRTRRTGWTGWTGWIMVGGVVGGVVGFMWLLSLQQASAHSIAHEQSSNNDRVMAAQKYGGVRKSTGEVTLTYYGHMAFKITSPRGPRPTPTRCSILTR